MGQKVTFEGEGEPKGNVWGLLQRKCQLYRYSGLIFEERLHFLLLNTPIDFSAELGFTKEEGDCCSSKFENMLQIYKNYIKKPKWLILLEFKK